MYLKGRLGKNVEYSNILNILSLIPRDNSLITFFTLCVRGYDRDLEANLKAHTCNLSYSRGRAQVDCGLKPKNPSQKRVC